MIQRPFAWHLTSERPGHICKLEYHRRKYLRWNILQGPGGLHTLKTVEKWDRILERSTKQRRWWFFQSCGRVSLALRLTHLNSRKNLERMIQTLSVHDTRQILLFVFHYVPILLRFRA